MPLSSYNTSARKALKSMQKTYGKKKGKRVFYALANKRSKSGSRRARVNRAYRRKR